MRFRDELVEHALDGNERPVADSIAFLVVDVELESIFGADGELRGAMVF